MKRQPKITNTIKLDKLAKIDGAGRRSEYVAFSQLDAYSQPMVVGEVESIDGNYVKVTAIDNLETVLVNRASTTLWYIEPAQAEKWKKDVKRGNDWCIEPSQEPAMWSVKDVVSSTYDTEDAAEAVCPPNHVVVPITKGLYTIEPTLEEPVIDDSEFLSDSYELDTIHDEPKIKPNLSHYIKADYTTASGRPGLVSPDTVSMTVLYGLTHPDQWYAKLIEISEYYKEPTAGWGKNKWDINLQNLEERYGKLNPGQIRMNVGTLIRTILKKHGEI